MSFMVMENYDVLRSYDTVKFVVGDKADLDKAREIIEKLWQIERLPVVGACTELPIAYDATGLPPEMGISSLDALAEGCIRELYKPVIKK